MARRSPSRPASMPPGSARNTSDAAIATPLAEIRNRVAEELARREKSDSLVPIDRDPVPTKYAERVRRYYEELGRSGDK